MMYLKDFKVIRPNFEESQKTLLEWIVGAHVEAKARAMEWDAEQQRHSFATELRENLFRLGLGENKILKRGFQIADCNHTDWERMQIYNIDSAPEGFHLGKRMDFFNEASSQVFEKMYDLEEKLPPHLIHVTCTGYVAPSAAQKLVSARSRTTTVTHAYHMGCYGSIPAIRMAMGHYALEQEQSDIVHTELCSLHMNPSLHSMEQLVVQSLFADGFIKYSLGGAPPSPSFKILAVFEELIENSTTKMTWNCNEWGFLMSLSKDIPVLIRRNLEGYLDKLAEKGKMSKEELKKARYAIHPGGPKIIENIADKLQLQPSQINHSVAILQNYGNMSSATLPHIWEQMLHDDAIKAGELIVSLAFGPGLSICGAIFQKE